MKLVSVRPFQCTASTLSAAEIYADSCLAPAARATSNRKSQPSRLHHPRSQSYDRRLLDSSTGHAPAKVPTARSTSRSDMSRNRKSSPRRGDRQCKPRPHLQPEWTTSHRRPHHAVLQVATGGPAPARPEHAQGGLDRRTSPPWPRRPARALAELISIETERHSRSR